VKTYYLIFNPIGPPAITESGRAATYWESKGCTIETYQRKEKESGDAHDHSGAGCHRKE
jgi:hypothetical protein